MIHTSPFTGRYTHDISYAFWKAANKHQFPIALWRLPQTATAHLIVDVSGKTQSLKIDLEELPAGFALSPFLNPEGLHTLFIKADIHYTNTAGQWQEKDLPQNNELASAKNEFLQTVQTFVADKIPTDSLAASKSGTSAWEVTDSNPQPFLKAVNDAVKAIEKGDFQKVVLSRTKEVYSGDGFDVIAVFNRLCELYPQAFVSVVAIPDFGVWLCASPETLISVTKEQIFKTISLAGTQAFSPDIPVGKAVWTQKEIEEQALVSRYIVNCFKKIRLREYDEVGPRTVIAGNLMHLRTDFMVDMKATSFPQLGTVMLELLHPTSAVCGMPKEKALDFILANEGYNRAFYSGYLGPVNVEEETHLFVNLRCMQLEERKAMLYAGAGITADSVAEKEWAETELKCQTLLKGLF